MSMIKVVAIAVMSITGCGSNECPDGLVPNGPGICRVPGGSTGGTGSGKTDDGRDFAGDVYEATGGKGGTGGTSDGQTGGRGNSGGSGGSGHMRSNVDGVAGTGGAVENDSGVASGGAGGDIGRGGGSVPVQTPPVVAGPVCGNGKVEPGEACDGDCELQDCDDFDECTTDRVTAGSPVNCTLRCEHKRKTAGEVCGFGSRTCDANGYCIDPAIKATCGNGTKDPGEICDGNCPTNCAAPESPCLLSRLTGHAFLCSSLCRMISAPVGTPCPGGQCDGTGACVATEQDDYL